MKPKVQVPKLLVFHHLAAFGQLVLRITVDRLPVEGHATIAGDLHIADCRPREKWYLHAKACGEINRDRNRDDVGHLNLWLGI